MVTTVTLDASDIGGVIFPGGNAARINVPANGRISVPSYDARFYIAAGAKYVNSRSINQDLPAAPRAGSAGRIVASTALANGTLSIANQPDVPRQLAARVDTGTSSITAGNLALTYLANDGTTQVDNLSLVAPATTLLTQTTTKGVVSLTSAIVTALAGGASPKIQVDDTNSLSVQVNPDFAGFQFNQTRADGVAEGQVAVASSAASWTPSTTPNGTVTYSAVGSYTSP